MPFMTRSRSTFQSWLPGRIMLPVGFALAIAAGTYVVAEDHGYMRGKVDGASAQARAEESVKTLARLVAQPVDLDEEPTEKGNRLDIPTMIRAIEPDAVYHRPHKAAAKPAATATAHTAATTADVAAMPSGVERFDQCGARCDSRDPMVTRVSYPVAAGSPQTPPASAPTQPLDLAAATPGPNAPPAPILASAEKKDEGFLGLPPLPSAGELVDRTVEGTTRAYDGVKQAVNGALDFLR